MTDLKPTGPFLEPLDARVDRFLAHIAEGNAVEAISACPFSFALRVQDGDGDTRFVVELIRAEGHAPEATAAGATELEAIRLAVLNVPSLAARLAKIEAAIAETPSARGGPVLTVDQIDYLAGIAMKDLRERNRGLAKAAPHAGQSPADFQAAHAKMTHKVERIQSALASLASVRAAIQKGRRLTDRLAAGPAPLSVDVRELCIECGGRRYVYGGPDGGQPCIACDGTGVTVGARSTIDLGAAVKQHDAEVASDTAARIHELELDEKRLNFLEKTVDDWVQYDANGEHELVAHTWMIERDRSRIAAQTMTLRQAIDEEMAAVEKKSAELMKKVDEGFKDLKLPF